MPARVSLPAGSAGHRSLLLIAAGAGLVLAGCAPKPRPPLFDLHARERIALLPLENATADEAIGDDLADALTAALDELDAVPVVRAAAPVSATTGGEGAPRVGNGDLRRLRDSTGCDLVLTGVVIECREELERGEPERIKRSYEYKAYKWGYTDTARTVLRAAFRITDARSGRTVWSRETSATGTVGRWIDLPWDEDYEPTDEEKRGPEPSERPDGTRWHVVDSAVRRSREHAVRDVVDAVLNDFRGRRGWTPSAPRPGREGHAGG